MAPPLRSVYDDVETVIQTHNIFILHITATCFGCFDVQNCKERK